MPSPDPTIFNQQSKMVLVALVGPTAVGKTEVALQLAERLDGEIISADSRLFYRGMDIGTAKPTREERQRVTHHLIDVVPPNQVLSLAIFQQTMHQVLQDITSRRRLPFLVGGTGQYVWAILEGWQAPAVEPNLRLRLALERWAAQITPQGLHQRLATLDPQAARQIDPHNLRRTVRALEVILSSGQFFSKQRSKQISASEPPYQALILGLMRPRAEIYARIDQRIEAMLSAGLVAEVQGLLDQGYDPGLPSLSAIGYRQIICYLQGQISLEEAVAQIKRQSRVFVRRQANWFKESDPRITWFQASQETLENTIGQMEAQIRDWLSIVYKNPVFS